MSRRLASFVCVVLAAACSPDGGSGGGRRDAGAGPLTDGSSATDRDANFTRADGGPPRFDECAASTSMAETRLRPVDIVWIIDRSGSMREEADKVQDNINSFAAAIGASGIDYHVVMISAMEFVRVPDPLGSDTARFRYVEDDVQSHDGLIKLVERFDAYRDFLRPTAATHFVVVTDDESERMRWMDFKMQMERLLGRQFIFHTIASPPGSTHREFIITQEGCDGPGNDDAAANGDEYWALSMATGGQRHSICMENWSGLFSSLTQAIAVPTALPCRYSLPPPPAGMELDRMRVNVIYTPSGGGAQQVIPFVGSQGNCNGAGWYYEGDDILVCPATCSVLSNDANGRVDIAFGCATVLI